MPYRKTTSGTMEFSGKSAAWMQDFQKWYQQDCGNNSPLNLLTYVQYLTLFYSTLAKGKWQNSLLTKGKIKTLDSFLTTMPDGNISVDIYATLDFLAEKLSSDERIQWSQYCRNEVLKLIKK